MKSLYEELNGSYVEVGDIKISSLISTDINYKISFWDKNIRNI